MAGIKRKKSSVKSGGISRGGGYKKDIKTSLKNKRSQRKVSAGSRKRSRDAELIEKAKDKRLSKRKKQRLEKRDHKTDQNAFTKPNPAALTPLSNKFRVYSKAAEFGGKNSYTKGR